MVGVFSFVAGTALSALVVPPIREIFSRIWKRISRWVSSWFILDHRSMMGGWYERPNPIGDRHICLRIRRAPSRAFRKVIDLDRSKVESWVQLNWPGTSLEPERSTADFALFRAKFDEDPDRECTLLVWNFGLVETSVPIARSTINTNQTEIAIEEILKPIASFFDAVNSQGFSQIFPEVNLSRRRMDWSFNLTSYYTDASGSHPVDSLSFEGRSLDGKPSSQLIDGALSQGAARGLLSRRPHPRVEYLYKTFLESVLVASGYRTPTIRNIIGQTEKTFAEKA
jgi:hypothetical protein